MVEIVLFDKRVAWNPWGERYSTLMTLRILFHSKILHNLFLYRDLKFNSLDNDVNRISDFVEYQVVDGKPL